jgi:hypothetical protein
MVHVPKFCRLAVFVLFALVAVQGAFAQGRQFVNVSWLPITDAERQMKEPVVDKKAGVEALFWQVRVLDEVFSTGDIERSLYHYVRLKVFSEEGKKKVATLEIPYGEKVSITSVAGRTVKPDGTILELSKDAIHDRETVKLHGFKRNAKTFAMPGVEVGAILEYRWTETRDDRRIRFLRLQFQREYPIQKVTYLFKPLPRDRVTENMGVWPFNCQPSKLELDHQGFNVTTLENVPAFEEEPMMPAEENVRAWVLVYYHEDSGRRDPDKYWPKEGKHIYGELKRSMKVSDDLKAAVAKVVDGAKDDEDKTIRLIRYLRANIRDFAHRSVTDEERARVLKAVQKEQGRSAADIFKSGIAFPDEMNALFAALAAAAGLEARPARVASRNDLEFNPKLAESYFLPSVDMAVRIGDHWKVFDVSTRLLPPNMLSWSEEGVNALITDPKKSEFIMTPMTPPAESLSSRKAALSLSAEGVLEGDIEETWTGHSAYEQRVDFDGESDATRQEDVRKDVQKVHPQAEVTAIQVENADDVEKLLRVKYHVKIPGYAQHTGKRLFFYPLYFERGTSPQFTAAERKYHVFFHYGWRELDEITIKLPEGYAVERGESPGELNLGPPGFHNIVFSLKGKNELICKREFVFGNSGGIAFSRGLYPTLKEAFDVIHKRDNHMLALRNTGGGL